MKKPSWRDAACRKDVRTGHSCKRMWARTPVDQRGNNQTDGTGAWNTRFLCSIPNENWHKEDMSKDQLSWTDAAWGRCRIGKDVRTDHSPKRRWARKRIDQKGENRASERGRANASITRILRNTIKKSDIRNTWKNHLGGTLPAERMSELAIHAKECERGRQ